MKDCKGKELAIGDHVAFIYGASSSPSLKTGHVTNISTSGRECSVDGKSHIYRNRVMKLPKEADIDNNEKTGGGTNGVLERDMYADPTSDPAR